MKKAILVDDEEIASEVLEMMLDEMGEIVILGKFMKISDVMEQAEELSPDLIFLDIEMPGLNGLSGSILLRDRWPDSKVIFVTAYQKYEEQASRLGVLGYLLKPVRKEQLQRLLGKGIS